LRSLVGSHQEFLGFAGNYMCPGYSIIILLLQIVVRFIINSSLSTMLKHQ